MEKRFTITYDSTTSDGFKIYCLRDMTKKEFNDGRIIMFSDLEYCEKLKKEHIANLLKENYEQLSLFEE